jgi:acetylornithine/succinyldiaminopimelate/putrescine aminotransferase
MGDEHWRNAFRPLLPGILHADYDSSQALNAITGEIACVIAETIQGEAGIIIPSKEWMQALRKKCTETGTLLILDEIQTGFGRTGMLWGFENFEITPDILLLGKALGGGMPLGAFVAEQKIMQSLAEAPTLGHITTFGGHPVCCAAGMAGMTALLDEKMMNEVKRKEALIRNLLVHPKIKSIRSFGLWLAIEFNSFEQNKKVIDHCLSNGALTDWFLFASNCLRVSPPLIITEQQIQSACKTILKGIELS